MVTVKLQGVNTVRVRLRSGARVTYYYAWKGGPRLEGEPGSPQFAASYAAAHAARKQPATGEFSDLIAKFKASPEYAALGAHTKRAYVRHLDQITAEFGDLPIRLLDQPEIRKDFIRWRNTMRETPRTADYAVGTLKRLLAWCVAEVEIETNQAEPIGRLHAADRAESIWSDDDVKAFRTEGGGPAPTGNHAPRPASDELQWALELALHTGLRQGDLIRLPWSAFDGQSIVWKPSKSKRFNRTVIIPATVALKALLKRIPKRGPLILTTQRGQTPWTADGLRSSFGKACGHAGVTRTFHDLRRTACTNLLKAGLDASQVALIMGWTEADVEGLKRKYVSRAAVVAAMITKLEPKP